MEIVELKIDSLHLDPENLRHHGNENIELIKKSLVSYGQYKPLIVDCNTMIVKIGNGRLQAMRELGWNTCKCVLIDFGKHNGMEVVDNRLNELSQWADESIDDWLLNDKGIEWWGVDSMKSVELFEKSKKSEKKHEGKSGEEEKEKKPKKEKVCPCCGKKVRRKQLII